MFKIFNYQCRVCNFHFMSIIKKERACPEHRSVLSLAMRRTKKRYRPDLIFGEILDEEIKKILTTQETRQIKKGEIK